MTTARQRVLAYIHKQRSATSREIARALRMTSANARHHLGILVSDGRVEVFAKRQEGRGRPEKLYRLAGTLVGDNLPVLADALLAESVPNIQMEALGKRLAGAENSGSQPLVRRLVAAVEHLNLMHYHARWDAGSEGPRIILGHCPYAAIIGKHPELCQMDTAQLDELLGMKTTQLEKLGRESRQCVFTIEGN